MLRTSATSYFHADGLGSITSLSNSAGTIANTYTYDSYGDLTASTGTLVNSFRYTGRESDPETGLYYYRARYYDPSTGRFLREDPAGFGGGINFYSYVSNTPPNGNDPFGLWSPAAHRQLIWNALHGCNGISDADIWQIQQGSQWFDDNFQDPIWSFGHAMSNGNAHQSPDDAKRATSAFISGQVGIAKNDLGAGSRNQALFIFGVAIHPVMDGTSPAHMDPQGNPIPWCGYLGCGGIDGLKQVNQHSGYDITGIERVQDLTVPIQQNNTRMIRNWYQALTGQSLDCGCQQ